MTLRRAGLLLALAALALGLAGTPAAAQCAMCKTALTGSAEGRSIAEQFNTAILVLLAGPYLVASTLAGVLFRRQIGERLGRLARRFRPGPGPSAP